MKIFYDSDLVNTSVRHSLVSTCDNLNSSIGYCNNMSIPASFVYRDYLNGLAGNLSNYQDELKTLIEWIDRSNALFDEFTTSTNNEFSLISNEQINIADSILI